ncbi:glutaredoxin domain-containing protein [uncultured Enterovirga sp.]|uniref:glutaredoxin domain-containing protein n=1 Tax=uncultured Enterovirga sp. TaxID=2026352 RepID=UPI0035CAC132
MSAKLAAETDSTAEGFSVFWQPGCTSCARVKEYLTKQGIPYRSVNVAGDPGGREELMRLGAKSVPVVARGGTFTFAQSIEDVAKFVGIEAKITRLAPDVLIERWLAVLEMAEALTRKVPEDKWDHYPVSTRDMRFLAFHVFQIAESFLRCVQDGEEDWVTVSMRPVPADIRNADDIVRYANGIEDRLRQWWRDLADKSCQEFVATYTGVLPLHHFLERQTWHSAQHMRQLAFALNELGVPEVPAVPAELYAGLPLPDSIW